MKSISQICAVYCQCFVTRLTTRFGEKFATLLRKEMRRSVNMQRKIRQQNKDMKKSKKELFQENNYACFNDLVPTEHSLLHTNYDNRGTLRSRIRKLVLGSIHFRVCRKVLWIRMRFPLFLKVTQTDIAHLLLDIDMLSSRPTVASCSQLVEA
jgi:hypothetical protein